MEFKKIYLTVSVIALTCSQYAVASPLDNTSHTHTQHTLELKPISNSFQLAAAVFLPDKGEDYGFNGRELNDNHGNTPKIDLCTKFPLSACPANAQCSQCPTGNKFNLSGCNEGFKLSAGTCVALTCPEINPAYRADVPVDQVCSTISASGKTCYQTCKAIDFSGYPVTSCPANATCVDHPDCATTATQKGNCSPIKKKVTTCTLPSQKLNANASGCVNKDDTCPTTYFKTCKTGTTGTAKYTELGTVCYQCKPTCNASIYRYDASSCLSPKVLSGGECGGKYEKCESLCGSEYIYNNYNCSAYTGKITCGQYCNGNYNQCLTTPYKSVPFNYAGMKFVSFSDFSRSCADNLEIFDKIRGLTPSYDGFPSCYNGDKECANVYKTMLETGKATLNKDLNCGNMTFDFQGGLDNYAFLYGKRFAQYELNGNNHTMTFDKPYGNDFQSFDTKLIINNLKVIHKTSYKATSSTCSDINLNNDSVFYNIGDLTNVDIISDIPLIHGVNQEIRLYGVNNFIINNIDFETMAINQVGVYGTLNIRDKTKSNGPYISMQVGNVHGTLNYMGNNSISLSPKDNGKANICSTQIRKYLPFTLWATTTAPKENIQASHSGHTYGSAQFSTVPNLCSSSVFSGSFWK